MLSKIWLSKSTYLKGIQCEKSLVLHKYHYLKKDAVKPELQALFDDGHDIENLARRMYFPNGLNLKPKSPKQWPRVITMTKQLLLNGQKLIYEAAFAYKGVMCAVDVLRLNDDGSLSIFEIKRSKKKKQVFFDDMAIQYWIIAMNGYSIREICLVQPEESAELKFQISNFNKLVQSMQEVIPDRLNQYYQLIKNKRIPTINMGEQCEVPYQCAFKGFCSKQEMAG